MRAAIILIAVLVASVTLGLFLREDNGYALLAWGGWSLETSLVAFLIGLIAAIVAAYLISRTFLGTIRLPGRIRRRSRARRRHQAAMDLARGALELQAGHWTRSERTLLAHVDSAEHPVAHYVTAARAAQLLGAMERRDRYLRLAYELADKDDPAILMTQAELALQDQQFERALATLNSLTPDDSNAASHTRLLVRCYEALHDWSKLRELLPKIRETRALDAEALDNLEFEVYRQAIRMAVERNDIAALETAWRDMSRPLKRNGEMLNEYVRNLRRMKLDETAADLIEQHLKQHWAEPLVLQYGLLETKKPAEQLDYIQKWTEKYGQQPVSLLTAARICRRLKIWGKAKQNFETCLRLDPNPQAYWELAELLVETGEPDQAQRLYQEGLKNCAGLSQKPMTAIKPDTESGGSALPA
ncbi:MAG: heme biosynthesis HemY N-terminal domain-containing protein [Pseudomonadota bacterium]|nr:heme biosynthesis HemY N-terminal domain-containing protein [Pseudomonadota bacterium]